MKKIILLLVLLVAILFAASEVLLPRMIEGQLADSVIRMLGAEQAQVRVTKTPALGLLMGQADSICIDASKVRGSKFYAERLTVQGSNVLVDRTVLANEGRLVVQRIEGLDATLELTEADLTAIVAGAVKGIKNAGVLVSPEQVRIRGQLGLANFAVDVTLTGLLKGQGSQIKFVTQNFGVQSGLTGLIGGSTLTEIPIYDLKRLPFPLVVRNIEHQQGKVIITAGRE